MMDLKDLWTRQERYEDLRAEASAYRMLTGSRPRQPWRRRAMRELGSQLMAWGWQLQQRYGAGPTPRGLDALS
jgi:hypothetical protein